MNFKGWLGANKPAGRKHNRQMIQTTQTIRRKIGRKNEKEKHHINKYADMRKGKSNEDKKQGSKED